MPKKKIKQRICIGCRALKHKSEFIRIVRNPEGLFFVDINGKQAGHGAYICKNLECLTKLKKKRGLDRAFKMKVNSKIYDDIEMKIKDIIEANEHD